jgi:hypothetical protein
VPLVRWAKIVFNKVRWKKNKKHRAGLPVVELKYSLYFVHLSKWFVYSIKFKFQVGQLSLERSPAIGYNVFGLGEGGV